MAFASCTGVGSHVAHRRSLLAPRRPLRRPRGCRAGAAGAARGARMCNVFIWSHDYEDDTPQEDGENEEGVLGEEGVSYDEMILGERWKNSETNGAGKEKSSREEEVQTMSNKLYSILREKTNGPDDMDGLRRDISEEGMDAMRRIVMGILGSLPGDTYEIVVTSDREGIGRLMNSSLRTGYTLRKAEIRMELDNKLSQTLEPTPTTTWRGIQLCDTQGRVIWWEGGKREMPVADYVRKLQAENQLLRERLHAQSLHQRTTNRLLQFMQSLTPSRVARLRDESHRVEHCFRLVVHAVLGDLCAQRVQQTYSTGRDYLAQLVLWCLFVGYVVCETQRRIEMDKLLRLTKLASVDDV